MFLKLRASVCTINYYALVIKLTKGSSNEDAVKPNKATAVHAYCTRFLCGHNSPHTSAVHLHINASKGNRATTEG